MVCYLETKFQLSLLSLKILRIPKVVIRGENKFVFQKNIYDCVRLYFNPKNPMLYRRKEIQNRILILCIDRKILLEKDVIISDGNASSTSTNFYEGIQNQNLKRLDWKAINAKFWNDYPDGKRKACAEVLINSKIPVSMIKKIICNNENTQNEVLDYINKKINITVEAKKFYYF